MNPKLKCIRLLVVLVWKGDPLIEEWKTAEVREGRKVVLPKLVPTR